MIIWQGWMMSCVLNIYHFVSGSKEKVRSKCGWKVKFTVYHRKYWKITVTRSTISDSNNNRWPTADQLVFFVLPWVHFVLPWVHFVLPWVHFVLPWVKFVVPWLFVLPWQLWATVQYRCKRHKWIQMSFTTYCHKSRRANARTALPSSFHNFYRKLSSFTPGYPKDLSQAVSTCSFSID